MVSGPCGARTTRTNLGYLDASRTILVMLKGSRQPEDPAKAPCTYAPAPSCLPTLSADSAFSQMCAAPFMVSQEPTNTGLDALILGAWNLGSLATEGHCHCGNKDSCPSSLLIIFVVVTWAIYSVAVVLVELFPQVPSLLLPLLGAAFPSLRCSHAFWLWSLPCVHRGLHS